jgi:transposase
MGKSLSLDLRQRVLAFIEEGHSRRHAAAVFRVSISSAIRIADRYRRTGDVAPMPQGRPRGGGKLEAYRAFVTSRVDAAPDITMPELAEALWAAHQVRAAPAVLSRFLKHRLGYTYKKNPDRHGTGTRTRAPRAPSLDRPSPAADAS